MLKKIVIASCAIGFCGWFFSAPSTITLGPGVMAADAPEQHEINRYGDTHPTGNGDRPHTGNRDSLDNSGQPNRTARGDFARLGDYVITPLAHFDIEAKVLSKKSYWLDREADISPVDLALGWGDMSDEAILQHIEIDQSNRWYRWQVSSFPIPRREIETQSANMHIIPATETVHELISDVRPGEVIRLSGKLVKVEAEDGWRWRSSLTREDTGANACEIVYVEAVDILSF